MREVVDEEGVDYILTDEGYPLTDFQRWLFRKGACSDARDWVGSRTPQTAWDYTSETSWMTWLLKWLRIRPQAPGLMQECGCCLREDLSADDVRAAYPTLPDFLAPGWEEEQDRLRMIPPDPPPDPTPATPGTWSTIWHIIRPEATMTLLTQDALNRAMLDNAKDAIVVQSFITAEAYEKLQGWSAGF